MKKILISVLLFLASLAGLAQQVQQPGETYVASNYGSYTSWVKSGNTTTGSTFIKAAPVSVYLSNGTTIVPFAANTPITVALNSSNAETVTPTVTNCYATSINCTLAATFSNTHVGGESITSGTFGLQEAINAAITAGSGTVLIDNTWQGPAGASLITAAKGSINVVVQDNRSGAPQFYRWNGSSYQLQASGSSLNLPSSALGPANVIYTLNQTTDQGTSTQFTDISGNGNNATFGATGCSWTGTGCDFTNSNQSVVNLPASINGDESYCADVSFVLYGQTGSGGNGSPTFNFFLSSATINTSGISWLVAGSDQIYKQFSFNGSIQTQAVTAEAGNHVICWIQGLSSNSTNDRFFTDGVENSYSGTGRTGGGQTLGHLVFGRNNFSQPGYFFGTLYNFVGWPGQITAAQATAVSNLLKNTAQANGVQVNPPAALTSYASIITAGDSITDGFGATTPWPSLLTVSGNYSNIINDGYYGISAQSINGQARWRDAPKCSAGYYKTLATNFSGTNDISNGISAAQTYGYLISYANLLNQAGCQVGLVTMISRTGEDTGKNVLNALIRAGAATGGYSVIDAASVPALGADGASSGADFNADGVHPNQTGQNALAAVISNGINAYGIGSASASNPTVYNSNAVTMVSADRFTNIIATGAATATLPECQGLTGADYSITNLSLGANTITFSGTGGETITGTATLAQNLTAKFRVNLISPSAAGCFWTRVQ